MAEIERRTYGAELRASDSDLSGIIKYNLDSLDLGGFKEQIAPGAFRDSLNGKAPVVALWNHDSGAPLGSTATKTVKLEDTQTGLNFRIWPNLQTSWGRDALAAIKSGLITGVSFGFRVVRDSWQKRSGGNLRVVEKAELIEISPVTFPAYPANTVRNQTIETKRYKNMDIKQIRYEIGKVAEELRKFDTFDSLSAEQKETYDRYDAEYRDLERKIKAFQREEFLHSSQHNPTKPDPGYSGRSSSGGQVDYKPLERAGGAIRMYLPGQYQARQMTGEEVELRALQMDDDVKGGMVVESEILSQNIIATEIQLIPFLSFVTMLDCKNAHSIGAPSVAVDPSTPQWTGELSIGSNDTAMQFDKRVLHPHPLAKYLRVSKTLARRNPGIVDFVKERLALKFSETLEYYFLNGNGSNQPLGVFTASDNGISTGRDVSTGNTTTAIKADNLIESYFTLKQSYRKNARWVFHRDIVKKIRQLKDSEGQYLWSSGLAVGKPDTILNLPFDESEWAPSTLSASSYVGVLGNWSYYWVANALDMQFQILTELFAATNEDGITCRREVDGMPVLEEAFVRVKLAAA